MYTTIIHPVRKALCLSCPEYIILDQIWRLSHNEKYGNWCIASKKHLSEWMDMSERTVYRAIVKLLAKELIIKDEKTGWLKSSDEWNEQMANSHDWVIGFKGKETQYISAKVSNPPMADILTKCQSDTDKMSVGGTDKMSYNSKNINTNITPTTGGVEKKLIKWFSSMSDVNNPGGLAKKFLSLYPEKIISRALDNPYCETRPKFSTLCEQYKKKAA